MKINMKKTQEVTAPKTGAYSDKKVKVMRFVGMILIAVIILTIPALASPNYGEQGGTWILGQIFWVALVVAAVVVIKLFLAGNYMKMLITAAVASLALVVIDNPQRLKTIGDTIWTTVFGA